MGTEPPVRTMVPMTPSRAAALLSLLALCACTMSAPSPVPEDPATATGAVEGSGQGNASQPAAPAAGTGTGVIDERVLPSGMTEVGAADAPVSLLLFTNADCGYCRDFHEDLLPRLMNDYVRERRLRITVSPFLVRKYENSERTALAQLCAAKQGKGMAMLDLLFRERIGTPAYRTALTTMGIDQNLLAQCTEDPATRTQMEAQQAAAASHGVRLIPSYVLNGTVRTGLPDYPDLRGQVEEALRNPSR